MRTRTRQSGQSIIVALCPAIFDREIRSPASPAAAHALRARVVPVAGALKHCDAPHPLGLLCTCRERPRDRRAAECGQQFPPSDNECHIRPSHARCVNGTIPRRKRAVFTLACWNSRAAILTRPILLCFARHAGAFEGYFDNTFSCVHLHGVIVSSG